MIEVAAEGAGLDQLLEVAMGCTTTRTSTVVGLSEPMRSTHPLPERAAAGLHGRRHIADFIQKQRAAMGCSNLPVWRCAAPVKEPFSCR